jgi:formylglycine-generating enzyme required for sulfatase activity
MRFLAISLLLLFSATLSVNSTDLKPGDTFKDCDNCPELVIIPAGEFEMGARDNDTKANKKRELPRRHMRIPQAFALGRFEVTRPQYTTCVDAGACEYVPPKMSWERDFGPSNKFPIVNMMWKDAQLYTNWLSELTGHKYSLPSEVEWEYAARAGTNTIF